MLLRFAALLVIALLFAALLPAVDAAAVQDSETPKDETTAAQQEDAADQETEADEESSEEKEPTSADVMREAIGKAREGDLDGAIEMIEKARGMDPDNHRITFTLIQAPSSPRTGIGQRGRPKRCQPFLLQGRSRRPRTQR